MTIRSARNQWIVACLLILQGCVLSCASQHNGQSLIALYQRLPDDAADNFVRRVLSSGADAQITTVIYGPEWETLSIIDRRLVDDTLRCTYYDEVRYWDGPNAGSEVLWYATTNREAIDEFLAFHRQLSDAKSMPSESRVTSNPIWKSHLVMPQSKEILLPDPWGTRGIDWLAEKSVLLSNALDEQLVRVAPQDWVDARETLAWDMNSGEIQPATTDSFYVSVFLEYFDLRWRFAFELQPE